MLAVAKQLFKLGAGFGSRRKRGPRLELQGAAEPAAQAGRQRLEAATRGNRPGRRDHVADARRVFLLANQPAEDQRQRDDSHLRDVDTLIESRQIGRLRHGKPQVVPVALGREAHLLQRGAHHILDDQKAPVRGDDQPLRSDRGVRKSLDVPGVLVQCGDGGHQLADQAERGVDVQVDPAVGRLDEEIRKARAGDGVRDDCKRGMPIGQPLDGAHAHERRVAERGQPAHALAQRELERRDRRELVAHAEHLERLGAARVQDVVAFAETVNKSNGRGREVRSRSSLHVNLCSDLHLRVTPHAMRELCRFCY